MKQVPVPTCATQAEGPRHKVPPAQGQPPSASRAQGLPTPCCSPGAVAPRLPAPCQGTGGSTLLSLLRTSAFDQVSGKREGDKEWDP